MKQRNKIDNKLLREAGVELMRQKNKMPLSNITRGNSMIGLMPIKNLSESGLVMTTD